MKWVKRKRTRNRALRRASFSPSLFCDTITEAQLTKAVSNIAGTLIFITGQINQPMRFFFLSLLMKDWASEGNRP